ncbi:hypothetical protein FYK55_01485 [Roseiconus nitratireducens]|uniref:Uncharacterized protein n=1 Tax=Roseiconus nitratireducens TaxID=2605748 RepID=A0A5M6DHT5_9BACT|nr:hypothetical protein [Roseiconus nitratireducens]KAA5547117.1 hypothetical protein FYK55_01485 [Roseiconus nitratireducens]
MKRIIIASCTSFLLVMSASRGFAQPDSDRTPSPDVGFDSTRVKFVQFYPVEDAKSIQIGDCGWVGDRLVVSGTRFDGEESRLWMMSLDESGQQQWFILLDPMRHNTDHLHTAGIFAYPRPFSRDPSETWSALVVRRGVDTGIRYVSKDGKVKRETEIGRIEQTDGTLWLSDERIYAFGSGELNPDSIDNAWIARLNEHGMLQWKTPIVFDELPSEVVGKEPAPGAKRYGGGLIAGGIPLADGTLLFSGAHRYGTSKFGTGPSDLFLVRMDEAGNEQDRHVLEARRVCSSPGIAEVDGSLFVLSTPQGFGRSLKEGYDIKLTRFDNQLNRVWEKDVQNSSSHSFGRSVLLSTGDQHAPLFLASPLIENRSTFIRARWLGLDGEQVDQTDIELKESPNTVLGASIVRDGEVFIVGQSGRAGFLVIRMPLVPPKKPNS